jgi:hypothetical protein
LGSRIVNALFSLTGYSSDAQVALQRETKTMQTEPQDFPDVGAAAKREAQNEAELSPLYTALDGVIQAAGSLLAKAEDRRLRNRGRFGYIFRLTPEEKLAEWVFDTLGDQSALDAEVEAIAEQTAERERRFAR